MSGGTGSNDDVKLASGSNAGNTTAQPAAPGGSALASELASALEPMFKTFFMDLADRDEKWRNDQILRDEKAQYNREMDAMKWREELARRDDDFKEWRKEQAKRDKDWRDEQAKRDDDFKVWREKQEKRDDEFKVWRERQEKRDDEFKGWREKQSEKQEKRDDEFKEWQKKQSEEQTKRDDEFKGWREKQSKILETLQAASTSGVRGAQAAPSTPVLTTPRLPFMSPSSVPRYLQEAPSRANSGASAYTGTPQTSAQKPDKFDDKWYIDLSEKNDDICKAVDLSQIFDILGKDWCKAWDIASTTESLSESVDIQQILADYRNACTAINEKLKVRKVSEPTYQAAFGALAMAVQNYVAAKPGVQQGLYWYDTHKTQIKRGDDRYRMPDGSFSTTNLPALEWSDIAVVVEIKNDDMTSTAHHVRGQILQDFIDMTETLPRRFMIGLTLAQHGDICVYVCVPGGVYSAQLGSLHLAGKTKPSTDNANPTVDDQRVVAFLLLLQERLCKDSGHLTGKNMRLPVKFSFGDIPDTLTDGKSSDMLQSTTVCPELSEKDVAKGGIYGRHWHLRGQRTWVYPAQLKRKIADQPDEIDDVFFKFQWSFDGDGEIDVHRFVLERGVPHVPKLLHTAIIEGKAYGTHSPKFKGEAMVMEYVGKSVKSLFGNDTLCTPSKIIDIFAGYVHTLVAAAGIDNGQYALHRDISIGNLMVTEDGSPYIIDWGCGRVCAEDDGPRSSAKEIIGTAVYMGIRILAGCNARSVIDDLESMFLVLVHYVWLTYGKMDPIYKHLWITPDLGMVKAMRVSWLNAKDTFFFNMGGSEILPKALHALVESLYELLFPSTFSIGTLNSKSTDPRRKDFKVSAWLGAFDNAANIARKECNIPMPNLDMLREHVRTNLNRRISFIDEPSLPPQENTNKENRSQNLPDEGFEELLSEGSKGNLPETPTQNSSKKRLSDLTNYSGNKKHRM
ncbi:hypothetical protein IW141_003320 [Coemansia sp. RSA 355]|nr:hypothetical protein IW141_003320 [Coemansia sp. RSA 355]